MAGHRRCHTQKRVPCKKWHSLQPEDVRCMEIASRSDSLCSRSSTTSDGKSGTSDGRSHSEMGRRRELGPNGRYDPSEGRQPRETIFERLYLWNTDSSVSDAKPCCGPKETAARSALSCRDRMTAWAQAGFSISAETSEPCTQITERVNATRDGPPVSATYQEGDLVGRVFQAGPSTKASLQVACAMIPRSNS